MGLTALSAYWIQQNKCHYANCIHSSFLLHVSIFTWTHLCEYVRPRCYRTRYLCKYAHSSSPFEINSKNFPQISVHLQVHMYIWSDSATPDGSGALRLRFSIWRYIEIKAFHYYIMQVITMLLMIEPAGKYRIIFHIFLFKQRREKLLLHSFFLWVIPRLPNFMCQRFGTLCLFHLHRWCKREK
jgi:hypothetical protein